MCAIFIRLCVTDLVFGHLEQIRQVAAQFCARARNKHLVSARGGRVQIEWRKSKALSPIHKRHFVLRM